MVDLLGKAVCGCGCKCINHVVTELFQDFRIFKDFLLCFKGAFGFSTLIFSEYTCIFLIFTSSFFGGAIVITITLFSPSLSFF